MKGSGPNSTDETATKGEATRSGGPTKHLATAAIFTATLVAAALFMPSEWLEPLAGLFEQEQEVRVFDTRVARIDAALSEGAPTDLTKSELHVLRADLQTRRLLEVGPMTSEQVRQVRAVLTSANQQRTISAPLSEPTIDAILAAAPRLDRGQAAKALATLRMQMTRELERQ